MRRVRDLSEEHGSQKGSQRESEVLEKTRVLKMKRQDPLPAPTRTPMGEFIIPSGGKALTGLARAVYPSAAEYYPKMELTQTAAPMYSIVGSEKLQKVKGGKVHPGPADYNTSSELIWHHRTTTFKARHRCQIHDEVSTESTDIGPARYALSEHQGIGKDGPHFSFASKHPTRRVFTGPPNGSVQPVDTHGFDAPGPGYRPKSSYWGKGLSKSAGRVNPLPDPVGPGPADYDVSHMPTWAGPSFSLSKRLPTPLYRGLQNYGVGAPAPNSYDLGSTIGQAVAITIGRRRIQIEDDSAKNEEPSPNSYFPKTNLICPTKAPTMAYRWFERKQKPQPGPGVYESSLVNHPKDPVYTCRELTKASFPDILQYNSKVQDDLPGPGEYDLKTELVQHEPPSYSMGGRAKTRQRDGPGPAEYLVTQKPNDKRAPTFIMGKTLRRSNETAGQGPAAYYPPLFPEGPKYTITKRRKSKKRTHEPGPNAYRLPSRATCRGMDKPPGIVFKSRATPYLYSGFLTGKIMEPERLPPITRWFKAKA